MASESVLESSIMDKGYNGRITWYVVMSCVVAALGGAIFGYDAGITGGVTSMEPFLKKFFPDIQTKMKQDTRTSNYCKFDSQLLTLFTSCLYLSGLVSSLLASSITRAYGRKPSILVGGIAVLVGSAIGGFALNIYTLIFGRLLVGVGIGFANQSILVYLVEMAPAKYRGAFNNGFTFSMTIGTVLANLVNFGTEKIKTGWGWRISIALAAIPAFILIPGALFLPETPNSIIERTTNDQEAKLVLQQIRGTSNVQEEFDDLIQASLITKNITRPFNRLISQRKYRPQLVMAVAIPFFQQMTGISVVGFYAPLLFRTTGFTESVSLLSAIVIGFMGMIATVIAMATVERFGRRSLFFFGGLKMLFSFLFIGAILVAELGDHGKLSKGYAHLVIILIGTHISGYCLSWGPLGFLVPSEIFQLEIRSAAQGITVATCFIFSCIIAQSLLAILCQLKAGIFFFFAGWIVLMTAFVYFFLPETKNVPIERMDLVWQEHWFWGKIVQDNSKSNNDMA